MIESLRGKYRDLSIQVKASLWFLICSFLQKGISVISTPIFTRLLATDEYGKYEVFNSWLSIITVFVTLNLYSGMYVRGLVKYSDDKKRFSSVLQSLCLVLVLIWTVIYLCFHSFFNRMTSLTTVQMLAMLLMIWSTAAFSFWSSEQRVDLNYKKLVGLTLVVSVAKPVIGILFVCLAEDKVTARILGLALVEVVFYTGCFVVQMVRGKKFFSARYWKEALLFNIPLVPHYLSMSVLNGADKIMIEKMIGSSEAGIYGLAYSLSLIMMLFNTALTQTIEPWLYKQIKDNKLKEIGKVAYPSWILIAMVNLALIAFAPEAVSIFAPRSYYDAIWIIPPVAMSVYFIFSYAFFAVFEFYFEKTHLVAVATCAGAVLNVVLNYIFIRLFGYYAAGYTTLFCYMVYAVCHFVFMRRVCRKQLGNEQPYNMKIYFLITAGFLASGFLLLFSYSYRILRYGIVFAFLVILFVKRKWLLESVNQILYTRSHKGNE